MPIKGVRLNVIDIHSVTAQAQTQQEKDEEENMTKHIEKDEEENMTKHIDGTRSWQHDKLEQEQQPRLQAVKLSTTTQQEEQIQNNMNNSTRTEL